jgi:ADP-heptose:LPS heptosyltransferase
VQLDEGKQMQATLRRERIDILKDKIITLALESSTPNRNWPFSYARSLTEKLTAAGYKVIWLSESKEFGETYFFSCQCGYEFTVTIKNPPLSISWPCPACQQNNNISEFKQPPGVVNFGGKTTMREALAIIALSDAFIGPNSGLMVAATSLDIPTVGLFGAFNPHLRAKFYEKFIPLWGKPSCAPCNEHWTECTKGYPAPCMKMITVDDVYDSVISLINKYPRHPLGKAPLE